MGTCLGMYVLYILKTKQGLCADGTGEFMGTIGQEVSKWDSLGITGQLSNKQEASNIYWCSGIHAYLNSLPSDGCTLGKHTTIQLM